MVSSISSHNYSNEEGRVSFEQFEESLHNWVSPGKGNSPRPNSEQLAIINAYLAQGSGGQFGEMALCFMRSVPPSTDSLRKDMHQFFSDAQEVYSEKIINSLSNSAIKIFHDLLFRVSSETRQYSKSNPDSFFYDWLAYSTLFTGYGMLEKGDFQELSEWTALCFIPIFEMNSCVRGAYEAILSLPYKDSSALDMIFKLSAGEECYAEAADCFSQSFDSFFSHFLMDLTDLFKDQGRFNYPSSVDTSKFIHKSNTPAHVLGLLTLALDGPNMHSIPKESMPKAMQEKVSTLIGEIRGVCGMNNPLLALGLEGYLANFSDHNTVLKSALDLLNT